MSIFLLFAIAFLPASAWGERPTLRFSEGTRANLRTSTGLTSEIVGRFEMDAIIRSWWSFLPFVEAHRLIHGSRWSRVEMGGELRTRPFLELLPPFKWFTVTHSLREAWVSPGNDHPEWQIHTSFDVPVSFLKVHGRSLGFYVFNEYIYDLEQGAGIRNEVSAGFLVPLPVSRFSLGLAWRHVDRVHDTDVDQMESSLVAEF